MKTESKMFRVEATWHQNANYFLQSIEAIAYQKPICSTLTGANSHAQVKLIFSFPLSLMYGLNGLNYLNVMADCCSKYHKTATFLHLLFLFLTSCGRLWCTHFCCSFPRKMSRRVSSHIQTGPPPPSHSPHPQVDALGIFWPWLLPPRRLWSLMGLCIKSWLGGCENVGQEDTTSGILNLLAAKWGPDPR